MEPKVLESSLQGPGTPKPASLILGKTSYTCDAQRLAKQFGEACAAESLDIIAFMLRG